jgi:hypothetical protein
MKARGTRVTCKCLDCGVFFDALLSKRKKGLAKYCTRECYTRSRSGGDRAAILKRQSRMHQIKHKYGVDEVAYTALLRRAGGVCEICKEPFKGNPYIDHNHQTGKIRGLLCNKCNTGLGMFHDSLPNLTSAINYLERNMRDNTERPKATLIKKTGERINVPMERVPELGETFYGANGEPVHVGITRGVGCGDVTKIKPSHATMFSLETTPVRDEDADE